MEIIKCNSLSYNKQAKYQNKQHIKKYRIKSSNDEIREKIKRQI